jgi:elongation factor 2
LAKSQNKHNKIYLQALPLHEDLARDIESDLINNHQSYKERANLLVERHDWKEDDAKKIWSFGPEGSGPNLLVDKTTGFENNILNELKEKFEASFNWATKEGVMSEEKVRGMRINILDLALHADTIHRGGGQIIPAVRRAIYASQLTAKPRFIEPVYLCDIQCYNNAIDGIY